MNFLAVFASIAPLWGFCSCKRPPHTVALSCSVMNLDEMPLCWFIQIPAPLQSGWGSSSYPILDKQQQQKKSPSFLWRLPFDWFYEDVFTDGVCSLSQLQTGSRGWILVVWYFCVLQQQQVTQVSTTMTRNIAINRMTTKKAPTSRGLACGRPCSLVHNFWRMSRTSSLASMLTFKSKSHREIGVNKWEFQSCGEKLSAVNVNDM